MINVASVLCLCYHGCVCTLVFISVSEGICLCVREYVHDFLCSGVCVCVFGYKLPACMHTHYHPHIYAVLSLLNFVPC